MRQKKSKRAIGARGFVALAGALVVGAIAVIGAGPARANNEFQNAFEDQLGRIAAYQAVAFGARVLAGAYYPVVAPVVVPVRYYAPPVIYAPSYGSYYGRPHKVKVRQVVYYQGRPRNAGYDRAAYHGHYEGGGHPSHGHGYRNGRGWH